MPPTSLRIDQNNKKKNYSRDLDPNCTSSRRRISRVSVKNDKKKKTEREVVRSFVRRVLFDTSDAKFCQAGMFSPDKVFIVEVADETRREGHVSLAREG